VSISELRRQIKWPEKTSPPPNLMPVLKRLICQKKLLLCNKKEFQKNYKKCLVEIYKEVSREFDEHSLNKNKSHKTKKTLKNEKDYFLIEGSLSRNNFQEKTVKRRSILSTLGNSLIKMIAPKPNTTKPFIFDSKSIKDDHLQDTENLLVNVEYCKELIKQARLKIKQVFIYSLILPRELFIMRLKHVLNVSNNFAINLIIIFLQIENQFNWDVFNNHFFFYDWDWHFENQEIEQQLCILNIMHQIQEIQTISKELNDSAIDIKQLKNRKESSHFVTIFTEARNNKLFTKNRIFKKNVNFLNSRLRDLAQKCLDYDKISFKIYKNESDILWTCRTNDLHGSDRPLNHPQQEPTEIINEFNIEDCQTCSGKKNSNSNSKHSLKIQKVHFKNIMEGLFQEFEDLVKKYFGDVKQGYLLSPEFEYHTFKKLLQWFRKVTKQNKINPIDLRFLQQTQGVL
jgi:hypothetical protein